MKTAITKDLVLAYHTERVRDPELRKAIEDAREWDPIVRRWFSLLTDLGEDETAADAGASSHRVTHDVVYLLAAEGDKPPPVTLRPVPEPDSQTVDPDARLVQFTYSARRWPFGVARLVVTVDGGETFRQLVAFPRTGGEDEPLWEGTRTFADLGIPLDRPSQPTIDVVFASEKNLGEFPSTDLNRLRDECNGDTALVATVDALVARLSTGG